MRRILSIDGGGIKGVFPAAFLAALEEDLPEPIGRYFDLIAGTSTGGIIALGLGLGMKASEILSLYETKGPAIFDQEGSALSKIAKRTWRKCRHFCGVKYGSEALHEALSGQFGERLIGESKTRLMIPAWDSARRRVYIFKTAHHERLKTDYKRTVVDAAMATAAAPTYFREHVTVDDVGLVDGGVWANNPTGNAVVEAVGMLDWPKDELRVLSIGCLDEVRETKKGYGILGLAVREKASFFMDGQAGGSIGIAEVLTGGTHAEQKSIYRVSQTVEAGAYEMDNTEKIKRLKGRGFAEAREQRPLVERVFFTEPAEEFVPEYKVEI